MVGLVGNLMILEIYHNVVSESGSFKKKKLTELVASKQGS